MNPLYQMLMGQSEQNQVPQAQMQYSAQPPMFQNPIQKFNYIMQAMKNPAAFVKQAIPNLPPQIANDPNQILQWMQQSGMVTQQDIQNIASQLPFR